MARVMLEIGGSRWPVNCRDGEEAQVTALGAMLDARWAQAERAAGDAGTARVLLLIALMLADELVDAQEQASASGGDAALESVAERLEKLASALERERAND
ncbi:cell division protein ZapA [Sphingomonas radiodurans]|uniref:cell division protein ZapA n=1 Tax=Sphingomonas radiodurans TaxID=2890321 RepID=UPI001E5CB32D|nr:cell division protein ZapA [Sphingomonas radiodurans]WBH16430.1 cell division protein ZapA [Sphingomonas radiodurans]